MIQGLSENPLIDFYKQMLMGRRLEEKVGQLYAQQKFSGFCHLYIGQEAVAVGSLNAIRKGEDYVIAGYRDHVMPVILGMEPGVMISELLGKVTGCVRGKGGSMHMFSNSLRFMGGHGIVGGQVPLAVGAGWKIKYKKEDNVVLCFLGDAAINQGQFHEALNMAAIWKLPCIFIIENNLYGMGTAISRTCTLKTLADRAKGYNMNQEVVDGRNVSKTYEHMKNIVAQVRETSEPVLVEMTTYRFRGHSVSDPGNYRTKVELEQERLKDCLVLAKQELSQIHGLQEEYFEKLEEEVSNEVEEAVNFALEADEPPLEELYAHVLV